MDLALLCPFIHVCVTIVHVRRGGGVIIYIYVINLNIVVTEDPCEALCEEV